LPETAFEMVLEDCVERDPVGELKPDQLSAGRVGSHYKRSAFERFMSGELTVQLEPDWKAHGRRPLDEHSGSSSADVEYFRLTGDVFGSLIPDHGRPRVPEPIAREPPPLRRYVLALGRSAG
jgi:hypothetical protein